MKLETVKFMLMAQDMDRAVSFYRDVIGLEATLVTPHWSELKSPSGAVVALHGGGEGTFTKTGLSFQVADLDAAFAEAKAGGAAVRRAPEDRPGEPIRLADLTDPEGNGFMLTQYVG